MADGLVRSHPADRPQPAVALQRLLPDSTRFVFSDTLLGYFPAGMIGTGPVAALVRYNIMFVLLHALALVGTYALVRQLGARAASARRWRRWRSRYAPWRWGQAGHMHVSPSVASRWLWRCWPGGTVTRWGMAGGPTGARARLGHRRLAGGGLANQPRLRHRPAVRVRARRRLRAGAAIVAVRRWRAGRPAAAAVARCGRRRRGSPMALGIVLVFGAVGAFMAGRTCGSWQLHPEAGAPSTTSSVSPRRCAVPDRAVPVETMG